MGIELMQCDDACGDDAIRVQRVLDSALDAVVSIDLESRITVWNGQAEKLFGWSREEAQGRLLEEVIIPQEMIEAHRRGMKRYLATGDGPVIGRPIEIEALHRSGKRIPVQLSITPIRIEHDAAGFTAFIRDLSYIKERQRKLEVSDERLQMVLDGADQGFWDIHCDSDLSALSSRCSTMLGYISGTVANASPPKSEHIHPDDRCKVAQAWDDHMAGRSGQYRCTYRMQTADGNWKTVHDSGEIIKRTEQGEPLRVVGTRTDMTDQQNLEASMVAAQKIECLGSVASGFAHDLNNILAAISGHASLVAEDGNVSPKAAECLGVIQLAVTRAKSLAENMMSLGRPSELKRVETPIRGCLESTIDLLLPSLGTGVDLTTDISISHSERVLMDISHFQQSIINLILNARDAIDGTGQIFVSARAIKKGFEDWVAIEVRDTGSGILPDDQPLVFEPFFTTKLPGEGTGIGLAVVKLFADEVGGSVDFATTVGQGTCFRFELPLEEPCVLSGDDGSINDVRDELRVVLVEDHDLLRPMLEKAIASDGHEVVSFAEEEHVLNHEWVENDMVDVLVIDVNLGETNGIELAQTIEAKVGHPVATIYSTGNPDSVAISCLEPWQVVMRKPFDVDLLLRAIQAVRRKTLDFA